MDVSTDFLRTFIAVYEYRSFSLATAKVHKSQGAISAQIAKLEEEAGSKLIDRSLRITRRELNVGDQRVAGTRRIDFTERARDNFLIGADGAK